LSWKVFYDDGTTFGPDDGRPNEAPAFGVIATVSTEQSGSKSLTEGDDYYFYHPLDERWFGVELVGLVDFLVHSGFLKLGRFIPQDRYLQIIKQALAEVKG